MDINMNETFMKEKPIFPLLLGMGMPMVLSMLVNSLYNIVDSYFVARISENAMEALSLVFPIQNFINAMAIRFGVGINALIATARGAGKENEARRAATQGVVLSVIHGIILSVICIVIMPKFLGMFTGDQEVIRYGVRYASVAFLFSPIIMAGLAFEKIFQAVGRMKVSMITMITQGTGAIINIILDPILIFGLAFFPKMGISGAAIATGVGQLISLAVYLAFYFRGPLPVKLEARYKIPGGNTMKKLYGIGIPAILNLALPSVMIFVLNGLLAQYSRSYVVILGIYYKLQTFLYFPASGIIQGMRPVIGYNFGAGERERVGKIYKITLAMAGVIMAAGTVLCLTISNTLIGAFTDNAETIAAGGAALRIISAGFIVSTVSVTASGALEGIGMGVQSLVISLLRYIVVILPSAFILCHLFGGGAVWNAFWITEFAAAVVAEIVYRGTIKRTMPKPR